MKEARSLSDDSAVSENSDDSDVRKDSITSLMSVNLTHNNIYIFKYKYIFLAAVSFLMIGAYYNSLFQGFIKN